MKNSLDTTFELSKLLKYSAKRKSEHKRLQAEMAPEDPGFRTLYICPNKMDCSSSFSAERYMRNYSVVQSGLDSFADMTRRDPEMSARCTGVAAQFASFDFLFGVEKVLSLVDNLSKALQHKSMSAAQGQMMAELTIKSLATMRTDTEFSNFWQHLIDKQNEDVAEPSLPRKRKRPADMMQMQGVWDTFQQVWKIITGLCIFLLLTWQFSPLKADLTSQATRHTASLKVYF